MQVLMPLAIAELRDAGGEYGDNLALTTALVSVCVQWTI